MTSTHTHTHTHTQCKTFQVSSKLVDVKPSLPPSGNKYQKKKNAKSHVGGEFMNGSDKERDRERETERERDVDCEIARVHAYIPPHQHLLLLPSLPFLPLAYGEAAAAGAAG
mmetsp:Transcript_31072/g.52485  ORF Transcript_31072/g.52485 Transcript_31072/m.52485 type:complete len:112 (+) Transcript_31072:232-567(+)